MKKMLVLVIIMASLVSGYGQNQSIISDSISQDTVQIKKKEVVTKKVEKIRLSADDNALMVKMIGMSKDSVAMFLKGAERQKQATEFTDVYYIYSPLDKKNIPLKFVYKECSDEVLRVTRIEYISRNSKGYKTASLRKAFWVEYIRDSSKK